MYNLVRTISGLIFSAILACFFLLILLKLIICKICDNKEKLPGLFKNYASSLRNNFHTSYHQLFRHQDDNAISITKDNET